MPAITRGRLNEIKSLAGEINAALARNDAGKLVSQLPELVTSVAEVNQSLAEIDEMLLAGLRDEALTMHDSEVIAAARLLDVRSCRQWLALHGWLLERGLQPPPPVNLDAAEHLAAVVDEPSMLTDDLAKLRRLALERAALRERLSILRRLRAADPASPVWIESLTAHEEARIREIQLTVPRAVKAGDIEALGAIAEELADTDWDHRPPADLASLTSGAVQARELMANASEANAIAAKVAHMMNAKGQMTPRDIDTSESWRQRLVALSKRSDELTRAITPQPAMLKLVQSRGLDSVARETLDRLSDDLALIVRQAAALATKRDFEAACQRLEYLCDHPPEKGGESKWLAELQRSDVIARAACQEFPELSIPILLRERVQRGANAIEAGEQLRRRFWVVAAVGTVAAVAVVTATIGWLAWKQGEYSQAIEALERRVAEARGGLHVDRPSSLDEVASRYGGDPRVSELVSDIEEGITAEKKRGDTFKRKLADLGETLDDLAADVAERRSAGEDRWLEEWPTTFAAAARILADCRRSGGFPDRRGDGTEAVTLSPPSRQRFQEEEDELAKAEARLAGHERTLATWAQQAFDSRLSRIQDQLADMSGPEDAKLLLSDTAALRNVAMAERVEGMPTAAVNTRIPAESLATLDALVTRLEALSRPEGQRKRGTP